MSVLATHLSASPADIRLDRVSLRATSGSFTSGGHTPMPQIRENSPSPGPTRAPSPTLPQDHHHLTNPSLDLPRPDSSASTTSSATLSGTPSSPGADNQGTYFGLPLVAEPESTTSIEAEPETTPESKGGDVWLAPSPVGFFTGLRYSRRDKLYVFFTVVCSPSLMHDLY